MSLHSEWAGSTHAQHNGGEAIDRWLASFDSEAVTNDRAIESWVSPTSLRWLGQNHADLQP